MYPRLRGSPDEECGGADCFNALKDEWDTKSIDEVGKVLKEVYKKTKTKDYQGIEELLTSTRLDEAYYWLTIDTYDRKKVNTYLKYYALQDERWQKAFCGGDSIMKFTLQLHIEDDKGEAHTKPLRVGSVKKYVRHHGTFY